MKIDAVIPAYNEATRIEKVIRPLIDSKLLQRVIVIDDGSTDGTAEVARACGAEVFSFEKNRGKAAAMIEGARVSSTKYVLYFDADLIGLTSEHIGSMLEPVLSGKAESVAGIFSSGSLHTDLAQWIAPALTGQRVLCREFMLALPDHALTAGYGIEILITKELRRRRIRIHRVYLKHMTHVMQEQKRKLFPGIGRRALMYCQVIKELFKK